MKNTQQELPKKSNTPQLLRMRGGFEYLNWIEMKITKLYKAVSRNPFWIDEVYVVAKNADEAFEKYGKAYRLEGVLDIGMKEITIIN